MKKGRFTEEQMVTILREANQQPIAEVAKIALHHSAVSAIEVVVPSEAHVVPRLSALLSDRPPVLVCDQRPLL